MLTALKTTFSKNKPKKLFYRDYKKFNISNFNDDLKTIFLINTVGSCSQFDQIFRNVWDKRAPLKRKLLRANHSSYIYKSSRDAIMRRSYLEKVYYKKNRKKALKHIRNRKPFAAEYVKKKGSGFL